jgi:hypothetical protein
MVKQKGHVCRRGGENDETGAQYEQIQAMILTLAHQGPFSPTSEYFPLQQYPKFELG